MSEIINEAANQAKKAIEIKQAIKQLVEFDIEGSYYRAETKGVLPKLFRKILFHDDIAIRAFLKELFQRMKELAQEKDLLPSDREEYETTEDAENREDLDNPEEENQETDPNEAEANHEETETAQEEKNEQPEEVKESVSLNIQIANTFLTE